ncbi:MAG: ribosome-associated translation inhibitor RaiA [Anaerolineae bacterium]|jgi:putative sigma-54 modulation protein|nr:ribosome-associated translation inhibitor RaiA [Anaerolineae bacterium]
MELILKGKNVEVTDRLREYVEQKIGKLDRYLPSISEAWVELSSEETKAAQDRQVCQVTVRSNGTILRAEERSDDMFSAIDTVLDKMYRQIARYKGKRKNRWRGAGTTVEPLPIALGEELEEEVRSIVRVKRFPMTPMVPEEAVEQMELLGHDFFVFFNAEEGRINVLYRRKGGNYGLLQPELD